MLKTEVPSVSGWLAALLIQLGQADVTTQPSPGSEADGTFVNFGGIRCCFFTLNMSIARYVYGYKKVEPNQLPTNRHPRSINNPRHLES